MVDAVASVVLAPDEGQVFRFFSGEVFNWKITGAGAKGVLDVGELLVDPGIGVPEHIHHGNDESFYVLEGTFRLTLAGVDHNLRRGSFVFVPRGMPHSWQNVGTEIARYLLIFTPGGMDQYFVELNPLLQGPLELGRFLPIFEKFRYELVGPMPEPR